MKQFIVVLMLLCAGMSALAVTPDNPVKEDRGRGRGKCLVKGKVIVKGSTGRHRKLSSAWTAEHHYGIQRRIPGYVKG
jgi:hypothetical protein